MKKTVIVISLVLALALSLCACKSKEKIKTNTSKEDIAQLGLSLEAPEGAENIEYAIVESEANGEDLSIAQISYNYNGIKCILRTANIASHNVSGFDESKAESEEQYDLNVGNYSSQIRVMHIDGKYVAIWTLGDHSYSLCMETDDSLNATSCAIDAANANVPEGGNQPTTEKESTTQEETSAQQQNDSYNSDENDNNSGYDETY
ncbi:MAG: hypothetical protein IJJ41_04045 [Clostridia bacterium]|nr:hypothetical protein [Clostridia bacterium]